MKATTILGIIFFTAIIAEQIAFQVGLLQHGL